jgi:CheY-like chemotaxis protein
MLGGDVEIVHTVPGGGTHIRLTLATGPLDAVVMLSDAEAELRRLRCEPVTQMAPVAVPVSLSGRHVLLVEDGPDNQRLICHVLRKAGAAISTANNGREGVDAVFAAEKAGMPFELIFMDIQMPVMDGYEAIRTLRGADYTRPIIALTAHAMAADHERCRAAGADDVATKPIDRRRLVALAEQYCCPVGTA